MNCLYYIHSYTIKYCLFDVWMKINWYLRWKARSPALKGCQTEYKTIFLRFINLCYQANAFQKNQRKLKKLIGFARNVRVPSSITTVVPSASSVKRTEVKLWWGTVLFIYFSTLIKFHILNLAYSILFTTLSREYPEVFFIFNSFSISGQECCCPTKRWFCCWQRFRRKVSRRSFWRLRCP